MSTIMVRVYLPFGSGLEYHCTQTGRPSSLRRSSITTPPVSAPWPIDWKPSRTRRLFSGVSATSDSPNRPGDFLGLETKNPQCRPVGGDKTRFEIFLDVADRRLLEEVPIAFFALVESFFVAQPFQFRRGPSGDDAHGEQFARLRGHRLFVEDGQWPRCSPSRARSAARRGNSRFPIPPIPCRRGTCPARRRVMAQVPAHHILAGSAGQVPLVVLGDSVLKPERQGPHPCTPANSATKA